MGRTDEIAAEMRRRIQADVDYYQGRVPRRVSIAWRAYLSALFDWGLLTGPIYDDLTGVLPEVRDLPIGVVRRRGT